MKLLRAEKMAQRTKGTGIPILEEFRSLARRAKFRRQRPVVCVLVVRAGDRENPEILLQRRVKLFDDTPFKGYWEIPQGRVDKNETVAEAARRELKEETGLTISGFLKGKSRPFCMVMRGPQY